MIAIEDGDVESFGLWMMKVIPRYDIFRIETRQDSIRFPQIISVVKE
jgi:hypothetical protein